MWKFSTFLLIIFLLQSGPDCLAQSDFDVSEPRFELKDNSVRISYDILNSNPSENFVVSVEITDADGKRIKVKALGGDIGEGVSGGKNKMITWDLGADNIVMNAEITVNIHAELVLPSISSPGENKEDNQGGNNKRKDVTADITAQGYNRTGLILQSLALPGLGLSRTTGNPHWIKGVAGYSCIAGSVVLNKAAVATYDGFLEAGTTEDAEIKLSKSVRQDNISEVLAYMAIGIWVSDIIWTVVGTKDISKNPLYSGTKGISVTTGIEPLTISPMVGIIYRF